MSRGWCVMQERSYRRIDDTGPPSYRGPNTCKYSPPTRAPISKKGHRRNFDTGRPQCWLRQWCHDTSFSATRNVLRLLEALGPYTNPVDTSSEIPSFLGEYNRKKQLTVEIIRIILVKLSRERDEAPIVAEALGPGIVGPCLKMSLSATEDSLCREADAHEICRGSKSHRGVVVLRQRC
ncbi:hypothetical protein TNCV_268181 [Trichonephila clavipes]|nr:hypothetical protein TNCV_268181 [Trichonephila clavipes]